MMTNPYSIGLMAGIVSALLTLAGGSGGALFVISSHLVPLPIFIASMGWHHRAGLIAAMTAAVIVAITLDLLTGVVLFVSIALPAWWLAYLALLARTDANGNVEWYPVGRLLAWAAGIATALSSIAIFRVDGTLEGFQAAVREGLSARRESLFPGPLPEGFSPDDFIELFAQLLPSLMPLSWLLITLVNLWLAARIARASGRLPRPWPYLPATTLPWGAFIMLAATFVIVALPSGFAATVATIGATALTTVTVLTGLCVVHMLTRGNMLRVPALILLYGLLILPVTHLILLMLAIADRVFRLRDRASLPPSST